MNTADNRDPPRRSFGTRRVIVLGDTDTADSADLLRDQAGQQGAVIADTHAFERGKAVAHQNLPEIDAVVVALSRAISIPADIWVPFPVEDLDLELGIASDSGSIKAAVVADERRGIGRSGSNPETCRKSAVDSGS